MFCSVPTRRVIENYKKLAKNFKKLKKIPLWLHFKPKYVGKGREREKIKIIVPFRYNQTHNRKFQKKAKKFKKLKNSVMGLFQAKVGRKRLGKRENRNYRFVPFLPDA